MNGGGTMRIYGIQLALGWYFFGASNPGFLFCRPGGDRIPDLGKCSYLLRYLTATHFDMIG